LKVPVCCTLPKGLLIQAHSLTTLDAFGAEKSMTTSASCKSFEDHLLQ